MTKKERERLIEEGYNPPTWDNYVRSCASEYGVDLEVAFELFDLLGPEEAFDGFVTELEELEGMELMY